MLCGAVLVLVLGQCVLVFSFEVDDGELDNVCEVHGEEVVWLYGK